MDRRTITAGLTAAMLALGAGACSDRENVQDSNNGVQDPQGGQATQQEPAPGLTPTGEEQPSVVQPDDGE